MYCYYTIRIKDPHVLYYTRYARCTNAAAVSCFDTAAVFFFFNAAVRLVDCTRTVDVLLVTTTVYLFVDATAATSKTENVGGARHVFSSSPLPPVAAVAAVASVAVFFVCDRTTPVQQHVSNHTSAALYNAGYTR